MDVTLRLETIVFDIERTREPILIVGKCWVDCSHILSFCEQTLSISLLYIGHQGIHRLLYAYFMGLDRDEAPYVSIPLNTVIELQPNAYGCNEKRYLLLSKEEMMKDGQDEPITSMPMKEKKMAEAIRKSTENARKNSVEFDVMNPPSF